MTRADPSGSARAACRSRSKSAGDAGAATGAGRGMGGGGGAAASGAPGGADDIGTPPTAGLPMGLPGVRPGIFRASSQSG